MREEECYGSQGIKEFSGGGVNQQWGCHKEINKEKTENVPVGFRSWEVHVKFDKDRFCRMVEAEDTCRRLSDGDKTKR